MLEYSALAEPVSKSEANASSFKQTIVLLFCDEVVVVEMQAAQNEGPLKLVNLNITAATSGKILGYGTAELDFRVIGWSREEEVF